MDEGAQTYEQRTIYVRFGPGPSQEIPLEWAEKMLAEWRNRQLSGAKPLPFGDALAAVVVGQNGQR